MLGLSVPLKAYVQCLQDNWVWMIKCMACKAFPYSCTSQPVHDIWLVFQHEQLGKYINKNKAKHPEKWMDPEQGKEPLYRRQRNNWWSFFFIFIWKELQLKEANDGRNFHILRYGEIMLAYTWFILNFRLTSTACLWPIKHTLYICFNH